MNQLETVRHDIDPVFDKRSRVLLLGTMPSPASRAAGFFYGHPQNRFWRVLAALFDEPAPRDTPEKRDLLLRRHIALWDVLASCQIEGASDASIRDARPNDLRRILQTADIQAIFTTGTKAGELYRKLIEPELGIPCTVLPSTSAANAKMKLDDLVSAYGEALLPHIGETATRRVLSVSDVAKLETAIADAGTPLSTLMERAGRALAKAALMEARATKNGKRPRSQSAQKPCGNEPDEIPPLAGREISSACVSANSPAAGFESSLAASPRIAVLCGSGNNGGDGWVAARELADAGCNVDLITKYAADDLSTEPARKQALLTQKRADFEIVEQHNDSPKENEGSAEALEASVATDGKIAQPRNAIHSKASKGRLALFVHPNRATVKQLLSQTDVIVDAILGTGFSGDAVRAPYDEWIHLANDQRERGARIVSADVPSGLSAQRGKAAEPCIKAHKTVTMITSKPGLETPYAFAFCGEVQVVPLAYIEPILEAWQNEAQDKAAKDKQAGNQNQQVNATATGTAPGVSSRPHTTNDSAQSPRSSTAAIPAQKQAARPTLDKAARSFCLEAAAQPAHAKRDPFRRAETEDDDGYDPYSDRPPAPEPFFEADPWA